MLNEQEILVNDSCIFFDLIDLKLLQYFFQLGNKVFTTSMVIGEITNDTQKNIIKKYILSGNLTIDTDGSFDAIQLIVENHLGLSYTDCSVLELATRKKGIIISSDKGLRNESKRRNITARGVLWIIEILFIKGIITLEVALEKLEKYPKINKRAPKSEILILRNKLKLQIKN